MQRIIIYVVLFLIVPEVKAQWVLQGLGYELPGISTAFINSIDKDTVWTTSFNSVLYPSYQYYSRTANGGGNWLPGTIPHRSGWGFKGLNALNFNEAWVILQNDTLPTDCDILNTTNGGQTWQVKNPWTIDSSEIYFVHFWNHNEGVCICGPVSDTFSIYTTTNSGFFWTKIAEAPSSEHAKIEDRGSVHGDTVWLMTRKGNILRSTDKGYTWTSNHTPFYPGGGMCRVKFKDNIHGIIYRRALDNFFYETSNGGITWNMITTNGPMHSNLITWVPGTIDTYVSVTNTISGGTLSYSLNGGHDWFAFDTLQNIPFYNSEWVSNTCGWACATTFLPNPSSTGIWKFTGTLTHILGLDREKGGVILYPNPCTGQINLVYAGFEEKEIRIAVYNMDGRQVYNKHFDKGLIQTQEQINLSSLPNGTYLLTFTSCEKLYKQIFVIKK